MEDEDRAMSIMPSGWGAPEVFFLKYLRALKTNPEPSLEDVLSAEEGMKTPRTRKEFINQYGLPSDYFTTDNATRGKYNEEWRKRKAITLPKKPELYPGSADVPQQVTDVYPLPPVQFDLSRVGRFGDGDKLPTARKAEERYANSTFLTTDHPLFSTSMRFNPKAYHEGVLQTKPAWNYRPAWITMEVSGNDTTYRERPEQKMGFNRTVVRQASNSDSNKSEYRTLLRRFNTAKDIAKLLEAKEETKSAPVSFVSFLKHMIPGLGEAYNKKVVAKHLFGTTKGGIVERSDNTRVASGRPQTVLSRVPWNAGRGPAADSPMRLFNDPYIGAVMMAMGPMAGRNLKSLGTPVKTVNGVNYYRNNNGLLVTALEMANSMVNIGPKLAKKVNYKKTPLSSVLKKGVYDLLKKDSYNNMTEDGYFDANGKWVNNNGINWDFARPIFKPKYADDIDNAFLMEGVK